MTTKRTLLSVNGKQRVQVGFCAKASACRILADMGAQRGDTCRVTHYRTMHGKNLATFDERYETFIF